MPRNRNNWNDRRAIPARKALTTVHIVEKIIRYLHDDHQYGPKALFKLREVNTTFDRAILCNLPNRYWYNRYRYYNIPNNSVCINWTRMVAFFSFLRGYRYRGTEYDDIKYKPDLETWNSWKKEHLHKLRSPTTELLSYGHDMHITMKVNSYELVDSVFDEFSSITLMRKRTSCGLKILPPFEHIYFPEDVYVMIHDMSNRYPRGQRLYDDTIKRVGNKHKISRLLVLKHNSN